MQHYDWKTPGLVEFGEQHTDVSDAFASVTAAAISGLLALDNTLELAGETEIRAGISRLLTKIASQATP